MRAAVLLVALAVALAGCSDSKPTPTGPVGPNDPIGGDEPGDPVDPTPPPAPITQIKLLSGYDLTGCEGVNFRASVDAASMDALLPDGYRAARAQPETGTNDRAQLVADLYQCSTFRAAGAEFPDVWFGRAYTIIEQPAAYPNHTADAHHYIFEMIAGEDILSFLWPAAGYPTHNGTTDGQSTPATATYSAGEYAWSALLPQTPVAGLDQSFAWYHTMENGNVVVWTGNSSAPGGSAAAGQLIVPAESPFSSFQQTLGGIAGTIELFAGVEYTGNFLVVDLAEPR